MHPSYMTCNAGFNIRFDLKVSKSKQKTWQQWALRIRPPTIQAWIGSTKHRTNKTRIFANFKKHFAHFLTHFSQQSRSSSGVGLVISMLYVLYQLPAIGLKTYLAVPSGFSWTVGSSSPSLRYSNLNTSTMLLSNDEYSS